MSSYTYADPKQLLRDVQARHAINAGDVLLALVHHPSTDQRVTAVTRVAPELWRAADRFDRSELLAEQMRSMPIPSWRPEPPEHSVMTIVARQGYCVIGAGEAEWLEAWLFSNHLCHAFSGELILVTEYGWTEFSSGRGGEEPCLGSPSIPAATRSR